MHAWSSDRGLVTGNAVSVQKGTRVGSSPSAVSPSLAAVVGSTSCTVAISRSASRTSWVCGTHSAGIKPYDAPDWQSGSRAGLELAPPDSGCYSIIHTAAGSTLRVHDPYKRCKLQAVRTCECRLSCAWCAFAVTKCQYIAMYEWTFLS